jgi:hypothetical protein
MTFRIKPSAAPIPTRKGKVVKNSDYLGFLHQLPCVVSGIYGVEAAHLSMASSAHGHLGRGKGQKAADRWALPLSPEEHRKQHALGERAYWRSQGINPWHAALVIWGLFSELGDDAAPFATAFILDRNQS